MWKRSSSPTSKELILSGFSGAGLTKFYQMIISMLKKSAITLTMLTHLQEVLIIFKPVSKRKIFHSWERKWERIQDLLITKWHSIQVKHLEVNVQGWCSWKEIHKITTRNKVLILMDRIEMTQEKEIQFLELLYFLVFKNFVNNSCKISKESKVCWLTQELQPTNTDDHQYHLIYYLS